ncbi:ankyrin-1-like [Cotesia glomerata]|uniref:ankyrin-1-like n=1 Tax=Cotesia glomerata TaxID=32391 RepID=UPI001D006EEF|nr:ankyrin-1-like [Cotesia glomerata]
MVDMEENRKIILSTLERGIDEGEEKTVRESLKLLHQLDLKHGSSSLKSNLGYDLLRLSLENKHPNITQLLLKYGIEINRTIARKTCNTPLHLAIKNNDLNIVKLLLKNGANTKYLNSKGKTPLYLAVELDHQDIAEILLKKDVSVNIDCRSSMAPVLVAASNGNEYLFNLLLSKGGKLNLKQFDEDSASMLQVAIEHRYVDTVEKIVKSYINKKIINDPSTEKLLTVAVMNEGNISRKIVELLLKAKFPIDLKNAKNSKFICAALQEKHYLIVNQLLKVGLDLDDYWDVLSTACKHNHIETVEAVIDKVKDSDYKDRTDDNSLLLNAIDNIHFIIKEAARNGEGVLQHHINIFNRWIEIMKIFLKKGIDVNFLIKKRAMIFSYNLQNITSLHYLANHASSHASLSLKPIANLLISAGAWTTKKESHIEPLDYAISNENPDVVEVLLQHTWDINDDFDKVSSLHYAAKNESSIIIEMLLKRGADVNVTNTSGNTLLHTAAASKRIKVIECLLEHDAQVNVKNLAGQTPLHMVVTHESPYNEDDIDIQCIEMLMKYKADIDVTDDDLMTPLHCAAKKCCHPSVIKKLLEYKPNINSISRVGLTPLLVAASFNRLSIVKFFIESGANISDRNKYGETFLHLMARRCTISIDEILEDNVNINVLTYKNKTALDYIVEAIRTTGFSFRYHENAKILIKYMLKLHNIGVFICKENLQGIDKYLETFGQPETKNKSDIVVFKEECEKEAVLLKENKIGNSNMTFYKLIKKSTHRLAQYLLNKNVIRDTKPIQYNKKFPIYSDFIAKSLKRGFERKNILDQDAGGLIKTMLYSLPGSCIDQILSYLDNEDLKAIIDANKIKMETNNIYTSVITRSRATKKLKLCK